jgi:hypothetical protein
MRAAATSALVAVVALLAAVQAAGAATWTLADHPPPPPGSEFRAPLGAPGDLQFFAPNRGLLAVEGNASIPRGLFHWNGRVWRQLSTVCGGPTDTTRIAWAGPTEFWTVTEPSLPRTGTGVALCRFRDGEVVASYSTPEQAADPFRRMNAATCTSPSNCWFAGAASADPSNEREGTFHLRWDGGALRTTYFAQGRGASDPRGAGRRIFETTFVGPAQEGRDQPPRLRTPEDRPRLVRRISGGSITTDRFTPEDVADPDETDDEPAPADATDLLAADADGEDLWVVGGGTVSGAPAPEGSETGPVYPRGPIAARLAGDAFTELPLADADGSNPFAADERFVDVAAVPGGDRAWVAVQRFADRRSINARGKVARLAPDGTVEEVTTLPTSGAGRGSIAKLAFTGPEEGWAVTYAGWILHFQGDGFAPSPLDEDPAFANRITFRPNEAAAQFVPDRPPVDDARLFTPPPLEIIQTAPPAQTTVGEARVLPPLLTRVRSRLKGRRLLIISFRLARRARIGVTGRRGKRVVARSRARTFKPGRRTIRVKLDPKRYPKRLSFAIRELDVPDAQADGDGVAGAGDTVTTGGGAPPAANNTETVTTGGGR